MPNRLEILKNYVKRRDEKTQKTLSELLMEFEEHRYTVKEIISLNKFIEEHKIPAYEYNISKLVMFWFDKHNNFLVMKSNRPLFKDMLFIVNENGHYDITDSVGFKKKDVPDETLVEFLAMFNLYYPKYRDEFFAHVDKFERIMFD